MRRRKFLGVGEALDVMHEARTRYWSKESAEHVESNWRDLLKVPFNSFMHSASLDLRNQLSTRSLCACLQRRSHQSNYGTDKLRVFVLMCVARACFRWPIVDDGHVGCRSA
jgi:hypothetical protein